MTTRSDYHLCIWDREAIGQSDKRTAVIIPTGATKRHGYLPSAADTMLAEQLSFPEAIESAPDRTMAKTLQQDWVRSGADYRVA